MTATTTRIGAQLQPRPAKFGKYALTLGVAAALAGCATPVPTSAASGNYGRLDLVGRGDGRVMPTYPKDGRYWVVGTPGQEYSVRVCNSTGGRMLAVISVDGVNVITGDTAAPSQSGYVLSAHECAEIGGWRKSMAQTAAFYFTELPDSYAARTGRPENVGVIGVAWFPERQQPHAWKDRPGKIAGEMRGDAPSARQEAGRASSNDAMGGGAESDARDNAAPAPVAPQAKLGTGHGRMESSPTQMVRFDRASPYPAETIAIHYDRRENLVAMGILPPPYVAQVPAPTPFPAWTPRFVPNPPR